jgi:lipopolysaccharide export system permease protein
MDNILTRYLAREILKTSAAIVLVLFVILMSNALGKVLADIADGEIPHQALWPAMLSQSVNILSLLLPIGMFLGIIFAFGRMYKDHEIVVMNASGISYRDFYKAVILILVPIFLISAYASLTLNAKMQRNALEIIERGKIQHEFSQFKPGQFNQSEDGNHVFFMESISADKLELQGVIISQAKGDTVIMETADSGRQKIDDESGDLFLVIGPGERYESETGKNSFKIIEYDKHGILVSKKNNSAKAHIHSIEQTLAELWSSDRISDKVELHWRIAMPMVLLVLAILAVPLSYIAPRQGRFGKVGYALLVYFAYLNLMVFTRAQLETGKLPLALNFWWVHLVFLIFTLVLLYRRNRGILLPGATAG